MIEEYKPKDSFKGSHSFGVAKLSKNFDEEVLIIKYFGDITFAHLKYSMAGALCTSNFCGVILDIREADLEIENKGIISFYSFTEHTLEPITKLVNGNFKILLQLKHQDWFEMGNCYYWMPSLKEYFCYSEEEGIEAISDYWVSLGVTSLERYLAHKPLDLTKEET